MPREKLHWSVLEEAKNRLKEDSSVKEILSSNKSASMIGAMAHDAPYYYKLGKSPQEKVGAFLHGSFENDTFLPLRKLAKDIFEQGPKASKEQLDVQWAFLLGMCSHFATDIVFHPLVYWWTGDYYHKNEKERLDARRKHRLFEVYLDEYISSKKALSILSLRKELGADFELIISLLDRNILLKHFPEIHEDILESELDKNFWHGAINYLGAGQAAFTNKPVGALFRALKIVFSSKLPEIEALFSYKRFSPESIFSRPLYFKNPVSGEERTLSIEDLREEAIEETVSIYEDFEKIDFHYKDKSSLKVLEEIKGFSLNFGIEGSNKYSAKFFAIEGLPIEGLE